MCPRLLNLNGYISKTTECWGTQDVTQSVSLKSDKVKGSFSNPAPSTFIWRNTVLVCPTPPPMLHELPHLWYISGEITNSGYIPLIFKTILCRLTVRSVTCEHRPPPHPSTEWPMKKDHWPKPFMYFTSSNIYLSTKTTFLCIQDSLCLQVSL